MLLKELSRPPDILYGSLRARSWHEDASTSQWGTPKTPTMIIEQDDISDKAADVQCKAKGGEPSMTTPYLANAKWPRFQGPGARALANLLLPTQVLMTTIGCHCLPSASPLALPRLTYWLTCRRPCCCCCCMYVCIGAHRSQPLHAYWRVATADSMTYCFTDLGAHVTYHMLSLVPYTC